MTDQPAPTDRPAPILAIDLGKTTVRLEVVSDGVASHVEGPGARLGESPEGLQAVQESLELVLARCGPAAERAVAVVAGVAGSLGLPSARAALARWLAGRTGLPSAVTSDIVLAHIGALAGGPGICLVAGTGAVALGVSGAGAWRVVDGWGPDIGDFGGGSWIGRAGVQAVLNALERGGPATVLATQAAEVRSLVARALADPANAARILASFAPAVLDAAPRDEVARLIVDRAVAELATTAAAAGTDAVRVAVLGGLSAHPEFEIRLGAALAERGLVPVEPSGTASDGALLVHRSRALALEGCVERAEAR